MLKRQVSLLARCIHGSATFTENATLEDTVGSILNQLEQQTIKVSFSDTYAALIRKCADLGSLIHAKRLHNLVTSAGLARDSCIGSMLVHMNIKCGDFESAQAVFESLPSPRKSILWNIMIGEHDRRGHFQTALELYNVMDTSPDKVTLLLALRVCANLRNLEQGKAIFETVRLGAFRDEIKLQNASISMFSKCGSIASAREVFDGMLIRDVVSWNSMITAYAQLGHTTECLGLYHLMLLEGFRPNAVTFSGVTSVCNTRGDVSFIFSCVCFSEFVYVTVVRNSLVSAYARCGDMDSARMVFDGTQKKDIVSWNSMIAAYSQRGHADETLDLYRRMDVEPDCITYASVLGACSATGDLETGTQIHSSIEGTRCKADSMVETALLNMYSRCGRLGEARKVFDGIDHVKNTDPSVWNAMLSAFVQHGKPEDAFQLFEQMENSSRVQPDSITILSLLSACCATEDIQRGVRVHKRAAEAGLDKDPVVETALFNMYAKCRRVDLAKRMFDGMRGKTVVPWNVMISSYAQSEDKSMNQKALDLYGLMDSEGVQPDDITFTHLLSACVNLGAFHEAKAVHERVRASGIVSSGVLNTAILTMYAKFDMLNVARSEFENMVEKSVTSWNAMIAAYAQHGLSHISLSLFERMNLEGVKPDMRTFVSVVGACSSLQLLNKGKKFSEMALSMGFEDASTAIVSMLAKCGELKAARNMFDQLKAKNTVAWNGMIAAYANDGRGKEALELYEKMRGEKGIQPDDITYASALGACSSFGGLSRGMQIHDDILCSGLKFDVFLETAILNMYGKCGDVEAALRMFEKIQDKNAVTWSAMVGAYIQHGYDREALELYLKMDSEGFPPSEITLAGVLAACSRIGALQEGKAISARIEATPSLRTSLFLQNSVLNMYAKCGCLGEAKSLFARLRNRDSFSWNTIIVGHAHHGDVDEVLDLQMEMVLDGVCPDYVTFACVLLACSHAGYVDRGRGYFNSMEMDFRVERDAEHFMCMVDMFARAGKIESAEELIECMPYEPPAIAWTTLLGSSNVHADTARGTRYAGNAAVLQPQSSSSYVLLWNIYSRNKGANEVSDLKCTYGFG